MDHLGELIYWRSQRTINRGTIINIYICNESQWKDDEVCSFPIITYKQIPANPIIEATMLKPRKLCQIDLLFLSYLLQSRGTVLPVASAVGLRGIWRTQQQFDEGLSTKSQRQHPTIDDATFQFFQPIQSYFQENDHKTVLSCEVDFGSDIHCPPPEPSVEQVPICFYNEATCSYSVQCLDANSAGVGLIHNPHSKTYCGPCKKSFDTKDELQAAVDRYEKYNIVDMELADKYGWPIGRWHVERITDMANLFFQKQTFNEDISQWDVGLVTNMDAM